jgi:ATP-binding cassette subfamily C protein
MPPPIANAAPSPRERGAVRLLLAFFRADPRACLGTLVCLVAAAIAEGIGITTLLPFLGLATEVSQKHLGTPRPAGDFERSVLDVFAAVGIEPTLQTLLAVVSVAVVLKGALMLLAKRQVGYTVARVATMLRLRLVRALLATDWRYFTRQPIGAFANAFGTEAPRAAQAFLNGATMLSEAVALVVYASIAFATSWGMTAFAIPISLVGLTLLTGLVRLTRRAGRRQTELLKDALARITDLFQGVRPLKAMAREGVVAPLLEQSTADLNRALRRLVLAREAVVTLQEGMLMASVAVGVYVSVMHFDLALDAVFLLALLFIRGLTSMQRAQRRYQDVVSDESAYWSMITLIESAERQRERSGQRTPALVTGIELRDVVFGYDETRVLAGVSFAIPAGRVTALHGPSGSGKTTLADLVAGLVHPDSGSVLVDGIPLVEIDLQAWRRQIGYVPQEMFLLHESVADNVSLGDPGLTRADVERALRAAAAWDFVSELPKGMDTPVGERGSQLSGGQRQLVAIARALVRRPRLLILDEATASLDSASEAALWSRIQALAGETTVLAISHQPGVLAIADRIYWVADGRVEERSAPPGNSTARYASTAGATANAEARERSCSESGVESSTERMAAASAASSRTGTSGP